MALSLGKLLASPRLAQPNLFSLDLPSVSGHQSSIAQYRFETGIEINQCAGDAMSHSPCLSRFAASVNIDYDVETGQVSGQLKRLPYYHATSFAGKELIDRLVIDSDQPFARFNEYPRHRALASPGAVIVIYSHNLRPLLRVDVAAGLRGGAQHLRKS